MSPLKLDLGRRRTAQVLCIGAHCDDIAIGCGATLVRLAQEHALTVTWIVLCSTPIRATEERRSAALFLRAAKARQLRIESFRDGFLPASWKEVKECFESMKALPSPDLIFSHERDDWHQDHRLVSELTLNTFRDHLIFEYEIPKYEGGSAGRPNLYVPIAAKLSERKSRYLLSTYASQRSRQWFSAETFRGLMRLRGIESNAGEGFAEAFYARKAII